MYKLCFPSMSMESLIYLGNFNTVSLLNYLPNSQGRSSCCLWQSTLKRGFGPLLLLAMHG